MNIYTGLLFQQGYIQDPALALSLAGVEPTQAQDSSSSDQAEPGRDESDRREKRRRGGAWTMLRSNALSPFR